MLRFLNILLLLLFAGCSTKKEIIPPLPDMHTSSGKIVIYQLMTRLFGNKVTVNKPYGTLHENGVGKFSDINNQALSSLRQLGITHVWYTGVIEHAVITDYTKYGIPLDDADVVKGRAGSPYAIKDYYDVNPDLANNVINRMAEFEDLIERTHQNKLKVIIDFVPNHVARSYKSDAKPAGIRDLGEDDDRNVRFEADNNFYYLPGESFVVPKEYHALGPDNGFPTKDGKFGENPAKVTGNDQFTSSPGIDSWFETVKLNYGVDIENGRKTYFDPVPNTWIKMKDILVYWANKNVDGFRCDMAEMVPVEFWSWAIPQVKAVSPEIIFIAEIYNPAQYKTYIEQGRFDYLYDKVQLYDQLRAIVQSNGTTDKISAIQKELRGINTHMLHFLENHDEQRIASRFFAGDPWKAVPAMVISATVDQGPVMIYFGQEVGEPGEGVAGFSGDDGRTTIFDYWGVPEHQKWMNGGKFNTDSLSESQQRLRNFYGTLLNLAQRESFSKGAYYDLTPYLATDRNKNDFFAYLRSQNGEIFLIVAGFSATVSTLNITIPADVASLVGLQKNKKYAGKDKLWNEIEFEISELSVQLELQPNGAYIIELTN